MGTIRLVRIALAANIPKAARLCERQYMLSFLTQPRTLWVLFALFVVETIAFVAIMQIWGFVIIDEISDPVSVQHHIDAMSATQRTVHAWMTATLDVLYPLTYGALFMGVALRALPRAAALPALAVIPTDLTEGAVQVLALTGNSEWVWLKAYITPLKLGLFGLAILIALIALVIDWRKMRKSTP